MTSGPEAFSGMISLSNVATPTVLVCSDDNDELILVTICACLTWSLEKTGVNCSGISFVLSIFQWFPSVNFNSKASIALWLSPRS